MNDKNKEPANMLKRPIRRRSILKGALAGTTLLAGSGIFAPRILKAAGGSITIGSFQDNAMAPFRDYFVKEFQTQTGITVNYNETNYDSWYQNCKNDGLNKTGAYDIYVMDDNWVPEFAAGHIVQIVQAQFEIVVHVRHPVLFGRDHSLMPGRRSDLTCRSKPFIGYVI